MGIDLSRSPLTAARVEEWAEEYAASLHAAAITAASPSIGVQYDYDFLAAAVRQCTLAAEILRRLERLELQMRKGAVDT